MDRTYYLHLAEAGLRMPIVPDLVLHEKPDVAEILLDGARLGAVLAEAAHRFNTPLAIALMDLELEKTVLLTTLGIPADEALKYQFSERPTDEQKDTILRDFDPTSNARLKAHIESVRWVAENTDLVPVGMSIGPFSLATKLLKDPISPIYASGMGITGDDDPDIATLERVLEMATALVLGSISAQIDAGAKIVFIAEPAANRVFFSPKQLATGADIFDRYAIAPNKEIKALLDSRGVDLLFHCCGELTDMMVSKFTELRPVILSLGSSRILWEDAAIVPKDIVLYGNLPSKRFYSDDLITVADVETQSHELTARMKEANHPFILGSECDILSVPGCHDTIMTKAVAMMKH